MKEINFSNRRTQWPRRRVIGGGGVFIGLSHETSRWAQIQIPDNVRARPDNVRLNRAKSGGDSLHEGVLIRVGPDKVWLSRTMFDRGFLFLVF
jgi:hypothetical protein